MLATFTSFLPAALQVHSQEKQSTFRPDDDADDKGIQTDGEELGASMKQVDAVAVGEFGVKKKDKKLANETFIFVRPPPSKSNHPLNLQVQLVPPNSRGPSGIATNSRQSLDYGQAAPTTPASTPGTVNVDNSFAEQQSRPRQHTQDSSMSSADGYRSGNHLSRTASNRSDTASMYSSGYSSVTSFSSVASSGTASSTRRMIIPLYNLQAHNVMTNTIVDAGTDAKIAKFQRRGLEMIDLAVLEPVEVWCVPPGSTPATANARGSVEQPRTGSGFLQPGDRLSRPVTPSDDQHGHTPTSSHLSVSSAGIDPSSTPPAQHIQHVSAGSDSPSIPTSGSKRNIFGKLFRKKGVTLDPSTTPTLGSTHSITHQRTPSVPTGLSSDSTPTRSKRQSPSYISSPTIGTSSLPPATTSDFTPTLSSQLSQTPMQSHPAPAAQSVMGSTSGLRPPVLGIQPSLSISPTIKGSSNRPTMYVWIIRRWLKGSDGGLFGSLGRLGNGVGQVGQRVIGLGINKESSSSISNVNNPGIGVMVEVRFEWKRGKSVKGVKKKEREAKRRSTTGRPSTATGAGSGSVSGSRRASRIASAGSLKRVSGGGEGEEGERDRERQGRQNRLSVVSHQSASTTVTSEGHTSRSHSRSREGETQTSGSRENVDVGAGEEDGESDPEDSETPWTCVLRVKRLDGGSLGPAPSDIRLHSASSMSRPPQERVDEDGSGDVKVTSTLRLKLGTMSPTPHHPKVVAMLKVPFPLPDVEVERLEVRKRAMPGHIPPHGGSSVREGGSGLELTAEELKDVVCSTGMWLVVREAFGGVGREKRKGDGWRIRA